jgi:hypothetical protein
VFHFPAGWRGWPACGTAAGVAGDADHGVCACIVELRNIAIATIVAPRRILAAANDNDLAQSGLGWLRVLARELFIVLIFAMHCTLENLISQGDGVNASNDCPSDEANDYFAHFDFLFVKFCQVRQ